MKKTASVMMILLILVAFLLISVISIEIYTHGVLSAKINAFLNQDKQSMDVSTLKIAYPYSFPKFDPLSFDSVNRSIIFENIYQPLVRFGQYYDIEDAIAYKWGLLSDLVTYEFIIKDNVYFHDDTKLTADDVINSINYTRQYGDSSLKSFLSDIRSIKKIDENTIHIILKAKDPFFLSKITTILIFKQNKNEFVGTGHYDISKISSTEIEFHKYPNYYSDNVVFDKIVFQFVEQPEERVKSIEKGESDIAIDMPYNYPQSIVDDQKIQIFPIPTLETYFLGFNTQNSVFKDINLRKAVNYAFDRNEIEVIGGGNIEASNQFASPGVFGSNPDISYKEVDIDLANKLFHQSSSFKRITVDLDLSVGLEDFGDFIKKKLYKIGFDVKPHYFTAEELLDRVHNGDSEFYLLGWKHESSDISEFLINMVHSNDKNYGFYNSNSYNNNKVDLLIEKMKVTFDKQQLQDLLQEIMAEIVDNDIFGIPLFNTDTIYGVSPNIIWQPRYDGYVVVEEMRRKVE